MAQPNLTTPRLLSETEEALTVLFCLLDDAYKLLNPSGQGAYDSLKKLSDSEVLTLALFQQLGGTESERSFLRDAQRFFSHLFPGVVEHFSVVVRSRSQHSSKSKNHSLE